MKILNNIPPSAALNDQTEETSKPQIATASFSDITLKEPTVHNAQPTSRSTEKISPPLPRNLIDLIRSGDGISLQPIAFVEVHYPEEDLMQFSLPFSVTLPN